MKTEPFELVLDADGRIKRIKLSERLCAFFETPQAKKTADVQDAAVRRILEVFFSGGDFSKMYDECVYDGISPWQLGVMRGMASIPRGKVLAYSGLARRLGSPRAARAVGTACMRNPLALLYPCHRIVQADGRIGAFMSKRGGALKRLLLEYEDVRFDSNGKILPECFDDA
jgi:O-6-methylguanine DNA methyltransferase